MLIKHSITIKTSGTTGLGYFPKTNGRLMRIRYVKDDYTADCDFTITGEDTGETIWTQADVNASVIKRPRMAIQNNLGGNQYVTLLKEHLKAHFKMNDNAATAVVIDAIGTYEGTYKDKDGDLNTNTGASTGKIGGALDFDGRQSIGGTDEHVDTGDPFESLFQGSFSISIWFKATDGQPDASVYLWGMDEGDVLNMTYLALGSNGTFLFKYTTDGEHSDFSTGVLLANGQETWHHIVVTADSTINGAGGLKLYFDGELVTPSGFTGNTKDAVFANFASITNLYIGAEDVGAAPNASWYGLIDNVMIFNKAVNLLEVEYLNNGGDGTEIIPLLIDYEPYVLKDERIKVEIAQAGDAENGTFHIVVEQ